MMNAQTTRTIAQHTFKMVSFKNLFPLPLGVKQLSFIRTVVCMLQYCRFHFRIFSRWLGIVYSRCLVIRRN